MYSQYDEEKYILEAVGEEPGRFLDIGAWDGKTFSNTLALVERGWSGVLIEPGIEGFAALLALHGGNEKLTLIHAAVGLERCMLKFWNTADAVSTTSERSYQQWKGEAQFTGCFYVAQVTLKEILDQFGGPFDFVSIDTEGTSVELFLAYPLSVAQPRAVCVEHDSRIVECMAKAQEAGYRASYLNGTNVVLTR